MRSTRKAAVLTALVTVFALVLSGFSTADTVKNNAANNEVGVGGVRRISVGESTTLLYWLQATNSGGEAGCDASSDSPITVAINTPEGVAADPPSLTFTNCGDLASNTIPVEFTATAASGVPGYLITHTSSDALTTPANFFLRVVGIGGGGGGDGACDGVSAPADPSFNHAPDGNNGWYKTTPIVSATGTGVIYSTNLVDWSTTAPTLSDGTTTVYAQAVNAACDLESQIVSQVYHVDTSAPDVALTGVANGDAYFLGNIPTGGCDTSDPMDGVASGVATQSQYSQSGGPLGTITFSCSSATDVAGNASDAINGSYSVSYGQDGSGIREPIHLKFDTMKVDNFSRGKTVPVKFGLRYDEPTGFDASGFHAFRHRTTCIQGNKTAANSTTLVGTKGEGFRYSASGDQYVLNADFRSVALDTCWFVTVNLGDGSAPMQSATFKIVK